MTSLFKQFVNNLNKTKYYLILANFLLVFFLILLFNLNVLPLQLGDFVFFSLIYLIFSLYRPGWSFLFFIGTIALENINLAPESLGISIRPFQLIGGLTVLALLIRFFAKRLNFGLIRLKWYDYSIIIFAAAGFLSSFFAIDKSLAFKQSAILVSFVALYWLVRNYIQTFDDLKKIAPFFLGSSIIIVLYGIWQNIRFIKGLSSFEVMPGRPNATFTEADWLGIFLAVLIAVIYSIIYYFISLTPTLSQRERGTLEGSSVFQPPLPEGESGFHFGSRVRRNISNIVYFFCLVPIFILLILTVSRSAWLGAGVVTLVFLKAVLTNFSFRFRDWQWKRFLFILQFLAIAIICSIGIVYIFHLTNFQLLNRAQSTGSGLQKITVACLPAELSSEFSELSSGSVIGNISELEKFGCRHINLEDIEKEKGSGFEILEVYRNDPNVSVRRQIYQKSAETIKEHPIFGIGWGNSSFILGKDERGAGLNSSNIFLEVWLGSGILGLLAFLAGWVCILVKSAVYCVRDDFENKLIGLFLVLGFFAFLIPNLFNAGVFLGIFWVWLGVVLSIKKEAK